MIYRNNALSINKDTLSLSLPQGREQVIVHYFCKSWTNQTFFKIILSIGLKVIFVKVQIIICPPAGG